ncbi:transcriptional regulator, LysR family [Bifidobacterium gallicum DSM 20093 = LMG 11596]|nr:LysR substrate-binding domain-containing protein [Bifidobacterium gallicum]KFI60045.1 transcriptional regulator, LysR family [Bifidobacterium gallicum DSM 20093 = LMG 11596]
MGHAASLRWTARHAPRCHALPNLVGTMNLLYNTSCFVKEGYGYALCVDGLVDASDGSGLTFLPLDPPMHTNLCIAWRSNRALSQAAQAFLDELRVVLAEHTDALQ